MPFSTSGSEAQPSCASPPADSFPTADAVCEERKRKTPDGASLREYHWSPVGGSAAGSPVVVIVHGYGEHFRRYDELASFFLKRGYAVSGFDWRGHGRSGGQRGFIRSFELYVDDLLRFLEALDARYRGRPLALLGHSTGGLMSLRALQRGAPQVAALILTNPLLRLAEPQRVVPDWLARALSFVVPRLPIPSGIDAAELTHDPAWVARTRLDPLCHRVATPRWSWSTTLAGRRAMAEAASVQVPTLVVGSGEDRLAEPRAVRELFERLGGEDTEWVFREHDYHEVLNEAGRSELFRTIADFVDSRLAPRLPENRE